MDIEKRKYSVVLCSYNKLEYLKVVANKVKNERPENELILSDDLSTDGTIGWANSSGLFSFINVQKEPGNYRLNTIRNDGIKLATNPEVCLLDADCLPDDGYFNGLDIFFSLFPNEALIGVTRRYNKSGEVLLCDDPRLSYCKNSVFGQCGFDVFYGGNVAFNKNLWQSAGGFDEAYNGCWGFEDLDLSYRLMQKGIHFYMCSKASVRHLEHPANKSATEASQGRCRNADLFNQKYNVKFM